MVKTTTLAALAGLAVAGTGFYVIATRAQGGGGGGGGNLTVTVTVLNSSTGLPVPYVGVTLNLQSSVTNASGVATFSGVAAGIYTVSVDASGYKSLTESVDVTAMSTAFTVDLVPCVKLQCACDQVWDSTLCQCDNLRPAVIKAPATDDFKQSWVITWLNVPPIVCGMAVPGTTCPSGAPQCDSSCNCQYPDSILVPITVKVTDSAGNPICGVLVDAGLNTSLLPIVFSGNLSNLSGSFSLSLTSTSAMTDSAGSATFYVEIKVIDLGNNIICVSPLGCHNSGSVSSSFSVIFSSAGLPNAITSVNMQSLICQYGSF